jgi:hypothetical protein
MKITLQVTITPYISICHNFLILFIRLTQISTNFRTQPKKLRMMTENDPMDNEGSEYVNK